MLIDDPIVGTQGCRGGVPRRAPSGRAGYHCASPRTRGNDRAAGRLEGICMRMICLGVLSAALVTTTLAAGSAPAASPRTAAMADNPFAAPSKLAFQLPPFDRIRDSDYRPALEAGMAEQLHQVAAIAHNREPPTFANTIVALERSGRLLERVDTTFSN